MSDTSRPFICRSAQFESNHLNVKPHLKHNIQRLIIKPVQSCPSPSGYMKEIKPRKETTLSCSQLLHFSFIHFGCLCRYLFKFCCPFRPCTDPVIQPAILSIESPHLLILPTHLFSPFPLYLPPFCLLSHFHGFPLSSSFDNTGFILC